MQIGQTFSPTNQGNNQQPQGQPTNPVQDAIRILSLQVPQTVGQGSPVAPGLFGNGSNPMTQQLLMQWLKQLMSGSQTQMPGGPPQMMGPGSGPQMGIGSSPKMGAGPSPAFDFLKQPPQGAPPPTGPSLAPWNYDPNPGVVSNTGYPQQVNATPMGSGPNTGPAPSYGNDFFGHQDKGPYTPPPAYNGQYGPAVTPQGSGQLPVAGADLGIAGESKLGSGLNFAGMA